MTESTILTGYPSIDKPWLQYYSQEQINAPLPECTAYDYLYNSNKMSPNNIALNYYGKRISYSLLIDKIEATAKAFSNIGVRGGDIVIVCMVNMPEMVYTLYALNVLGATINLVDPRTNPDTMREYINECRTKIIVTVEPAYLLLKKAVGNSCAEKIITVSPANSMKGFMKVLYRIGNKAKKLRTCDSTWDAFINAGTNAVFEKEEYIPNRPFVMAHTGGTTGVSKTVVLSQDNLNAVVHAYRNSLFNIQSGHRFLNDLPPFIIYGLSLAMHAALCIGMEVILYPKFEPQNFPRIFWKYKPNHFSDGAEHIRCLFNDKRLKNKDMSFLLTAAVGGDSLDKSLEQKVNAFLNDRGCVYGIQKGYGMSELGATAVTTMHGLNEVGSVGIPVINNNVKIIDTETGDELKYNQIGEIWISGPSLMLGYYHNEEETNKVIARDENGIRWIRTGDLGRMTEKGILYHEGRTRRIYLTSYEGQPAKIFPLLVEEKITLSNMVSECCVVGRLMRNSTMYEAVAFLVQGEQKMLEESLIARAKNLCLESVPSYMVPVEYYVIDKIPRTPIGKVDFRKLEKMASEDYLGSIDN